VFDNGGNTFTLTGTQLNGISEGAAYGDDAEMSSNYPIVRLRWGNNVTYAWTSGWSSFSVYAVGSNTPETVQFSPPFGGIFKLNTIANGIASPDYLLVVPTIPHVAIIRDPLIPDPELQVVDATTSAVLGEYSIDSLSSILVSCPVGRPATLTVDYRYGNPLPAGGLNFQSNSGVDTLNVNDPFTTTNQTFTLGA